MLRMFAIDVESAWQNNYVLPCNIQGAWPKK